MPQLLSVQKILIDFMIDRLRSIDLSAHPDDKTNGIHPHSIVFTKNQRGTSKHDEGKRLRSLPGVLLMPIGVINNHPSEGTNESDDVVYPFVIQVVDKDYNHDGMNLSTYTLWHQRIRRSLNTARIDDSLFEGHAFGARSYAVSVDTLDESKWIRHNLFQTGISVQWHTREPRGLL